MVETTFARQRLWFPSKLHIWVFIFLDIKHLYTLTISNTYTYYSEIPSYIHHRFFLLLCFPLIPSNSRHKLQASSIPCEFLGYPSNHRGYKCLNFFNFKIFSSHPVLFNEYIFPFLNSHSFSTNYDVTFFLNHSLAKSSSANLLKSNQLQQIWPLFLQPKCRLHTWSLHFNSTQICMPLFLTILLWPIVRPYIQPS